MSELQKINVLPFLGLPLSSSMHASEGTGMPLVKGGCFAADLIHFRTGEGVGMHAHPGSHVLYVLWGVGWLDFAGETHRLLPGDLYLIPGGVPHAVRADDAEPHGLTLLCVANDHRPVDSCERLEVIRD